MSSNASESRPKHQIQEPKSSLHAMTGRTVIIISGIEGLFSNLTSLTRVLLVIAEPGYRNEIFVFEKSDGYATFSITEIIDTIDNRQAGRQINAQIEELLSALTHVAIAKHLMRKGRQRLVAYTYDSRGLEKPGCAQQLRATPSCP